MNKTQLIDMAAAKSGLTKKDTTAALESIIDSIQKTLAKGEQVALVGFGTFSVKKEMQEQLEFQELIKLLMFQLQLLLNSKLVKH